MTLAEFQAKFEGVLLSAPQLAAAIADLVQDERADEREQCANTAIHWTDGKERDDYDTFSAATAISFAIRNRNTKEVE